MMRVQNMRTLVVMMMSMTLRGVIAAVAIPVIAAIVVPALMSALRKRRRIETRYDLLLKKLHGCLLYAIGESGMVVPLGVVGSHFLSVRKTIALSMSTTSMSFSDIDGTTVTATETKVR